MILKFNANKYRMKPHIYTADWLSMVYWGYTATTVWLVVSNYIIDQFQCWAHTAQVSSVKLGHQYTQDSEGSIFFLPQSKKMGKKSHPTYPDTHLRV